jgi:hypothetical protein
MKCPANFLKDTPIKRDLPFFLQKPVSPPSKTGFFICFQGFIDKASPQGIKINADSISFKGGAAW